MPLPAVPVALDLEHLVGQQLVQPGPLQLDLRIVGELLQEQHIGAGRADEPDEGRAGCAALQHVDGQHGKLGTAGVGLAVPDRPGNDHGGHGGGRGGGGDRRPLAAQRQRGQACSRGGVRGQRHHRHRGPLQQAETVHRRKSGDRPSGDAARYGPLNARRRHGIIVARLQDRIGQLPRYWRAVICLPGPLARRVPAGQGLVVMFVCGAGGSGIVGFSLWKYGRSSACRY